LAIHISRGWERRLRRPPLRLDLDLDVSSGAITDGLATIRASSSQALTSFNLDFRGPRVDRVAVDGAPADYARRGAELVVTPATPIAAGAPFTVEVAYRGEPRGGSDPFVRGWNEPRTPSTPSASRPAPTSGSPSTGTPWTRPATRSP
jgi:aminopeptidase N